MRNFKKNHGGVQAINNLGLYLQTSPIGKSIVSDHAIFKGLNLSHFNSKIQRYGIEEVLPKLQGYEINNEKNKIEINKEKIKKRYINFQEKYKNLIEKYLKPDANNLTNLIAELKALTNKIYSFANKVYNWFCGESKTNIPVILAYLFAIWTLINAKDYFEMAKETEDTKSFLFQPHVAQVISIFRMMSCGDDDENLRNNLVQIGTGEGKSVTLAMTSAIFALLGYEINCVCYSSYLSHRDYQNFKEFFIALDVDDYITYGTFNKLCEDEINADGNIREKVLNMITNKPNEKQNFKEKRTKILLIDEVDVFFSKEFFGALYKPSAVLKNPSISELLKYIWAQKKLINYQSALNSPLFKKCLECYPEWELLLKEVLKDIIAAVTQTIPSNYVVKEDKIGYIDQDSVQFNISYGYSTIFSYFLENEKHQINNKSLEDHLGIEITTGNFSYAEVPKKYEFIMGVTGTLENLAESQKRILEKDYNIKKWTLIPSVFGQNKRVFDNRIDFHIEDAKDYYEVINEEIRNHLDNRAVLVFFEDQKKLKSFYESQNFMLLRDKAAILTESATPEEKKGFVSRSSLSGNVSLMTRCFGRGTDFICMDESVLKAGGVHVIQTFLSEEKSEQSQIMGRCARQGDRGSYSMVLSKPELELFLITNIPDHEKYEFIDAKRNEYFNNKNKENEKFIKTSNLEHQKSLTFLLALNNNDKVKVNEYLCMLNNGAAITSNISSRTICLMDATGSMSNLLQKSKNTVALMFSRAKDILMEKGMNPDCFAMQFVVYRNYSNKQEKILVSSPWESNPANLKAFMDNTEVDGGLGNEAIELGLWHANQESISNRITQVILIGDAAANTKIEVLNKRKKYFGEKYWASTKFSVPTFYKDEVKHLKNNHVKVHCFYVDIDARECFEEIAKETGGNSFILDVNDSEQGSALLTDSVTIEILKDVGSTMGKEKELVAAYNAKYAKKYN